MDKNLTQPGVVGQKFYSKITSPILSGLSCIASLPLQGEPGDEALMIIAESTGDHDSP
jgi:hypothetical protein